ncbi:MAG: ABC transporter ATP-binding protein [Proteobacteria bacterium]|nr:ABC transporter ATP-binding protein [Pseudomonadota bacterium]
MIEVRDLVFSYAGSAEPTIRELGFTVAPGEIFGFLGPSGAGKSTTQRILVGLLHGYAGAVQVLGGDLRQAGPEYYERIGVSFEVPNLYLKLSAVENLRYFAALYEGETEDPGRLLEKVGLSADADTRVSHFSKGMKVRLGFVRALLNKPDLLFLDEPTAGLDPVNARNIKEIIREAKGEGRTIFLTTHDMAVADQLCDRVAFIVEGGLSCVDSPRKLKLQHGRRAVRVEYSRNGALESREFPLSALAENDDFLALLRDRAVETIHTQETTLEGVFINVTGRSLS